MAEQGKGSASTETLVSEDRAEDAARAAESKAECTVLDGSARHDGAQVVPSILGQGVQGDELLFVEICCGCALLSKCMAQNGFHTFAVDFQGDKHKTHVHAVQLDLRLDYAWSLLEFIVCSRKVFLVHAAPPFGTALRARTDGPPLRSSEFPLGLPTLRGAWKVQVESANAIFLRLLDFLHRLNDLDVRWTVENPARSYMWDIGGFRSLMERHHFVTFHSCMYGDSRRALTGILSSHGSFESLRTYCDSSHEHDSRDLVQQDDPTDPRQGFAAAHSKELCQKYTQTALADAEALGYSPSTLRSLEDPRIAAGKLPRGRRFQPLVPEFHFVTSVVAPEHPGPLLDSKQCLLSAFHDIPAGSKQLRTSHQVHKKGEDAKPIRQGYILRVFGVYHEPEKFLRVAKQVDHPIDSLQALPDQMLRCLFDTLTRSPLEIAKHRLTVLQKWRQWAAELEPKEVELRRGMDPGCAQVLHGKRLCLLQKIAESLNWPDKHLHRQLAEGFRLTGLQRQSGIFAADVKLGSQSLESLMQQSDLTRRAIWVKVQEAETAEWSQPVWDMTMEEARSKHWLEGPYSEAELDSIFDGSWIPVRRFGVHQRGKWRPIDDFSECGVNSTFSYLEKIDLRALDEFVLLARLTVWQVCKSGTVEFRLKGGERLVGKVHPFWTRETTASDLVLKTIDLKSAYKQLAMHPDDRRVAVLAIKNPATTVVNGFICKTLPFGSTASVIHFNRVARLLQRIGQELLVNWTNFFDDYPVLTFKCMAAGTDSTVRALLSLLGYTSAIEKEAPFDGVADMLGVSVDLRSAKAGSIFVGNKSSRVQDLRDSVDKLLVSRVVQPRALPSLFGRALFVESNLLGRAGKLALSDLRHLEKYRRREVELDDVHVAALEVLRERYDKGVPRAIPTVFDQRPVLVFTDGACETVDGRLLATVGGIIFDPASKLLPSAFGCIVPDKVVRAWMNEGKEHPVPQTELYAVVLARFVWKEELDGKRVIYFVDNQGTLDACIKGYSRVESMRRLLLELEQIDSSRPAIPWFARVPSASNIADLPSRGRWRQLEDILEFGRKEVKCFMTGSKIETFVEEESSLGHHSVAEGKRGSEVRSNKSRKRPALKVCGRA